MNDIVSELSRSRGVAPGMKPEAGPPPEIGTDMLLGPRGVLHIRHRGELYLLRMTRQGKLILTK
jgi:hemin uptake protein HemP